MQAPGDIGINLDAPDAALTLTSGTVSVSGRMTLSASNARLRYVLASGETRTAVLGEIVFNGTSGGTERLFEVSGANAVLRLSTGTRVRGGGGYLVGITGSERLENLGSIRAEHAGAGA